MNLNNFDNPIQPYFEHLSSQIFNSQISYRNVLLIEKQEATFEDTIWFYLFPPHSVKFNKVSSHQKISKNTINLVNTNRVVFPHYSMTLSLGSDTFQYR